ncbi:hypothetical protein [Mucilaginibacter sp. L3T2-6]|uniref:hypothetical protein n=1 Tax=Mucilaginibacter sp. L3T2-6 TaxID=3062491 RepID=UPI002675B020|nr:hypothetical protein [Mucilaginibacter sp. L3T2-6]MDO3641955.1 hypothetical protein [Mucilaginibacter sp. L3T2-6]MDV6214367.1 hypothetical protein [Mucilaginibacter sp. L3T2-6]
MTLGFSTKINGKPNYFPEKIISALQLEGVISIEKACELLRDYPLLVDERLRFIDTYRTAIENYKPKGHTIRRDEHNRWRAGMDIHPVINNRTRNRFQFAPVIKCVRVQDYRIGYFPEENYPCPLNNIHVYIDGNVLSDAAVKQLAINDGFDTVADFFAYFNTDFTGKIIHWTDLKY